VSLIREVQEIRLLVAENTAILRALVNSAERRAKHSPAVTETAPPPSAFTEESVRLLRALVEIKRDGGGGAK
jgi:hypothetical protein